MGLSNATIRLHNPRLPELEPVEIDALADTGAVHLCIPEHIRLQLKLDEIDQKEVTLTDGSGRLVPYVGPIELRYKNRIGFTGALVMGDTVVLGRIPMDILPVIPEGRETRSECDYVSHLSGISRLKRDGAKMDEPPASVTPAVF